MTANIPVAFYEAPAVQVVHLKRNQSSAPAMAKPRITTPAAFSLPAPTMKVNGRARL